MGKKILPILPVKKSQHCICLPNFFHFLAANYTRLSFIFSISMCSTLETICSLRNSSNCQNMAKKIQFSVFILYFSRKAKNCIKRKFLFHYFSTTVTLLYNIDMYMFYPQIRWFKHKLEMDF